MKLHTFRSAAFGRATRRAGVRRAFFVAALAGLALLAAGCGGSSSPSVASLGTTTAPSSAASSSSQATLSPGKVGTAAFLAFAHCMTSHGVPVSVSAGSGGHGVSMSVGGGGQVPGDKNSPQFASAQKACGKLLPGGGPGNETPAEAAQSRVAELALAQCMRSHGYPNFPDPTSQGVLNLSNAGVNPQSPQFQAAMQTCGNAKGKGVGPVRIRIFSGPPGATPP